MKSQRIASVSRVEITNTKTKYIAGDLRVFSKWNRSGLNGKDVLIMLKTQDYIVLFDVYELGSNILKDR